MTRLIINNAPYKTSAVTLAQLAEEQKLPPGGVAVAVDNKLVPRTEWASFALSNGQQITILKAFSGG